MIGFQQIALLAATVLLSVLLFGAAAHAIVPHDHSGSEAVWASLHDSLRHEDKKPLPLSFAFTALGCAALIVLCRRTLAALALRIVDDEYDALRRGVFAYRRFG